MIYRLALSSIVILGGVAAAYAPKSLTQQEIGGAVPTVRVSVASTDILFNDRPWHDFAALGGSWKIRGTLGLKPNGYSTNTLSATWQTIREAANGFLESDAYVAAEYAVGFPVTSLAFLEDGSALVAGASARDGRTIIQRWQFAPPSRVFDSAGNPMLVGGRVTSKTLVFSPPASANFPRVSGMTTGGGLSDDQAFLVTSPESSIYKFDASTGVATLIADDSQAVGNLQPEQLLTLPFTSFFYWGEHAVFGYCYVLGLPIAAGSSQNGISSLMLVDLDKDGAIDDIIRVSEDPNDGLQLRDPALWLE